MTLAELDVDGVDALLRTWQEQMRELAAHPDVAFVLIFENKGEAVGVSNPHPHCQIYATNFTFKYIETELAAGRRHLDETGRVLFQDILRGRARRTAGGSSPSTAVRSRSCRTSPATRTKRTWRRCGASPTIADLDDANGGIWRPCLRDVVIRFDNLWRMPFPYVMALHQAPVKGDADGLSFPHRVPPAAAAAEPAEVPGRARRSVAATS